MKNYREKLKNIKAFVFDYDGVLSNGSFWVSEDGTQFRQGNVRDGYALQLARKKGFRVAVITGSQDKGILTRCTSLLINDVFLGVSNKKEIFLKYLESNNISASEVLFMGDDLPDYEILKLAGIAACPADACEEIKSISEYISPFAGGAGCVRDAIEQVLKINGLWMDSDAFHW
jgi:3-deoxy-D-manno-octulosonate 8-phosphate phosphatase (KDO 8-P phosphatase)